MLSAWEAQKVGSPENCLGQPPYIGPYVGWYHDLSQGDISVGMLTVNTQNPVQRPFYKYGRYYGLNSYRGFSCKDMFGRSSRCTNEGSSSYGGITFLSETDHSIGFGGDPFWQFDFTGETGRAEFFEIVGAQSENLNRQH